MSTPCAVIILNWNGENLLREFLPSVVENTPAEVGTVIVADNGSTDGSVALLRRDFPSVEVLEFPENYGFAEGYNRAVAALAGRFPLMVLLNSDVATPTGWLIPLVEAMEADPRLGACQPKILSYKHPAEFEYAGACGGYLDRNGYPYCRGRLFATVEHDHGQYDTPQEVFWATGAALMVRADLYMRLGGLDADFFAHMEEIDLCWRIRLDGWKIKAIPASKVFHLGGGSLPASNPRKTYLNFRNNLLLLHKNLPQGDLHTALLRRRLLDTLAWAKFVATADLANAGAVWRAHRDFARMRRNYTTHPDTNLLRMPRFTDAPRFSAPNLLTAYYLRGIRRFSQLHPDK